MRWSIGIDVGGTFTDLVAVAADGSVRSEKVLSTPHDQSEGVARALAALAAAPADVERIVHGTTVATNMLLERRGARVVLCATEGATDLLELRRQDRASLYDLAAHHPAPLVAPDHVVPVRERIAPEGVTRALDDATVARVADAVASRQPEIVAIALLHAYADDAHERRLQAAIAERLPDVDVVRSSDVLPEIREYERSATTVAEAYLRPGVARYLRHLAERLEADGFPAPGVVGSSGGMRPAVAAARAAASLALSGPAGGVSGAAIAARAAGFDRALTIDIGGTSADVGLVLDGAPLVEPGSAVGGVPIALPRVLVEAVSAGGGSIAWRDDGGALRVGPRSAGSVPGPAAFARGGSDPTVTDAHIVLGNIAASRVSGGVSLDATLARVAVERLAASLGADTLRTAAAIVATADATMARALRRVSVERGIDPRSCVLVAFGGGGPLHACGLADRLGMRRVLVPPHAGVLSALGLAAAPERREAMTSLMRDAATLDAGELATRLQTLASTAASDGTTPSREWRLRARYRGQGHELDVPATPGESGADVAARFASLHRARTGFVLEVAVELVSARCAVSGEARAVTLARRGPSTWSDVSPIDDGTVLDATVRGPVSIALPDATMLVARDWTARALPTGGWLLERDA